MTYVSTHPRLWVAALAIALTALAAGVFAVAGGRSAHERSQPKPTMSAVYPVDDSRPQGPSDPPGLVGVPVRR